MAGEGLEQVMAAFGQGSVAPTGEAEAPDTGQVPSGPGAPTGEAELSGEEQAPPPEEAEPTGPEVAAEPTADFQALLDDPSLKEVWGRNPQAAKRIAGMVKTFTQHTQRQSQVERDLALAKQGYEQAAAELQAFQRDFNPREPGERAYEFIEKAGQHAERLAAAEFKPAEYQRLKDDEGEEAAEKYRAGTRLVGLELERDTLRDQVAQLTPYKQMYERSSEVSTQERAVEQKCKQAGLTGQAIEEVYKEYFSRRARYLPVDLDEVIQAQKARIRATGGQKPSAMLKKGLEQVGKAPAPKVAGAAQAARPIPDLRTEEGRKKTVEDGLQQMAALGLL